MTDRPYVFHSYDPNVDRFHFIVPEGWERRTEWKPSREAHYVVDASGRRLGRIISIRRELNAPVVVEMEVRPGLRYLLCNERDLAGASFVPESSLELDELSRLIWGDTHRPLDTEPMVAAVKELLR